MSVRRVVAWGVRFAVGIAAGVTFHYALYRIGMPVQPFIYQSF